MELLTEGPVAEFDSDARFDGTAYTCSSLAVACTSFRPGMAAVTCQSPMGTTCKQRNDLQNLCEHCWLTGGSTIVPNLLNSG